MLDLAIAQKRCTSCKEIKPITEFYTNRSARSGYGCWCKECDKASKRTYYKSEKARAADRARYLVRRSTPEGKAKLFERSRLYKQSPKGKFRAWQRYLEKNYGITSEKYDLILESQGGVCAICGTAPQADRRHHIDHDHVKKLIRGILCSKCNQAIGLLNENPELLDRAKEYLLSHKLK
jgi:hypothetical protein